MADLKSIKTSIENNTYQCSFTIFKYYNVDFIPYQYVNEISKQQNLSVEIVEDLALFTKPATSIFGGSSISDSILYLYIVDKFECLSERISRYNNLIVICKTIDKDTEKLFQQYIVSVPKLEDWQIADYVYSLAEGVDTKLLDSLIKVCNNDIYRLDQELKKIKIFDKQERNFVFNQFIEDGIFNDLSKYTIFDFSNAIVKKDIATLRNIYREIDRIDIEPIGLVTVLLNNFRNIIKIQLASNPTAESCGMKPNQFWAIKYSCGIYTKDQLLFIFDFLTEIDKKIKTGMIPVDSFLIDYIVVSILTRR